MLQHRSRGMETAELVGLLGERGVKVPGEFWPGGVRRGPVVDSCTELELACARGVQVGPQTVRGLVHDGEAFGAVERGRVGDRGPGPSELLGDGVVAQDECLGEGSGAG